MTRQHPPRVSIITIFLNPGSFLEEAITSVVAQTCSEWELLLVDDGSTDESTAIAKRWESKHPDRIRYLEHAGHKNRGMSASRNLGLHHASGEFLAILDADDVWPAQKLDEQLPIMHRYPEAALLYGPAHYWHSWTGNVRDMPRDFVQDIGIERETLFPPVALLDRWVQNSAMTPSTGTFLLRREMMRDSDRFENSFLGLYEDQVFCIKIGAKYPVVASPQVWLKYRQHEGSCCAVGGREKLQTSARRAFLLWTCRFMRQEGLGRSDAARHVKREYRHHYGPLAPFRAVARRVVPQRARVWLRELKKR